MFSSAVPEYRILLNPVEADSLFFTSGDADAHSQRMTHPLERTTTNWRIRIKDGR